ncbi:NADP-dependent isocitrate dehydrogenase, partial [Neisseria sicca]|uniref:NADP-dependent isocitrate dehydrogenase n=1 Tax=Neisseria sicca TaxID=490 RepID=UPI0034D96147
MQTSHFFHNQQSLTLPQPTSLSILFTHKQPNKKHLRQPLPLKPPQIIHPTLITKKPLLPFLPQQVKNAKTKGVLFS